MKKWIGLITAAAFTCSSLVHADDGYEESVPVVSEEEMVSTENKEPPKQVGKVSVDAANAARSSTAAKYVLAAGAVVLGVAAIILVSRHHGHH